MSKIILIIFDSQAIYWFMIKQLANIKDTHDIAKLSQDDSLGQSSWAKQKSKSHPILFHLGGAPGRTQYFTNAGSNWAWQNSFLHELCLTERQFY